MTGSMLLQEPNVGLNPMYTLARSIFPPADAHKIVLFQQAGETLSGISVQDLLIGTDKGDDNADTSRKAARRMDGQGADE
jgi:hypothetical protein